MAIAIVLSAWGGAILGFVMGCFWAGRHPDDQGGDDHAE